MDIQRVSLITLGVRDLDVSCKFYTQLGWKIAQEHPGVIFFQLKGLALGLFPFDAFAEDQGRPDAALGVGGMSLAINFTSEAEVDSAFDAALAAGAESLKAPEKVFWGGYSGYFTDPDGHVWELAMNPFWPLNEDGSLSLPVTE